MLSTKRQYETVIKNNKGKQQQKANKQKTLRKVIGGGSGGITIRKRGTKRWYKTVVRAKRFWDQNSAQKDRAKTRYERTCILIQKDDTSGLWVVAVWCARKNMILRRHVYLISMRPSCFYLLLISLID